MGAIQSTISPYTMDKPFGPDNINLDVNFTLDPAIQARIEQAV